MVLPEHVGLLRLLFFYWGDKRQAHTQLYLPLLLSYRKPGEEVKI